MKERYFEIVKVIAQGGFGMVIMARLKAAYQRKTDPQLFALKYLPISDISIKSEIMAATELEHQNIVRPLDWFVSEDKKNLIMVMEFLQNGTLLSFYNE
jgi:serine/threonine protein kinase